METIITALAGKDLLADPYLNKGSAFPKDERDAFGLNGFLPVHCSTLDEQLERTYENFCAQKSPIEKYIFLAALQDRNEILFYRLVQTHVSEMVPILYTPTVGEACQRYSHLFRRARGLYLSYTDAGLMAKILHDATPQVVDIIVVTDGERILGLGDLGVGGMGIPVGKLSLYTLCAGIDPRRALPVLLDVGTNNKELLNDPLYLGWKHERLKGEEYDRFVDLFVDEVHKRWPRAILQWEDFSKNNAWRLLQRHRAELASFNDDIQGTAAVTVAGLLRAFQAQNQLLRNQRIVIAGRAPPRPESEPCSFKPCAVKACRTTKHATSSGSWTLRLVHEGRTDLSEEKTLFAQKLDRLHAVGRATARPPRSTRS